MRIISFLLTLGFLLASVPLYAKTYVVKQGDSPFKVAKQFGITPEELLRYNSMRLGGSFKVGTQLKIPKKGQVIGNKYTVKSGDSVAKVADFFGVAQDDLRRLNRMGPKAELKKGETIQIPMQLRSGLKGHVIKKGDTIAGIAKANKVSVKELMAANKLTSSSSLQIGRTLVIPDKNDLTPLKPKKVNTLVKSGKKVRGGVKHTVQAGQNLWIIARAYNVPKEKIAAQNNIELTTPLNVGDVIMVPGAKAVVPVRVKGFTIQPIVFVRVKTNETRTLRLLRKNGRVSPFARKKLSHLARPLQKGIRNKRLHPRLIHMLQRVAERFPGKAIHIYSAYRPGAVGSESKHSQGRAIDFKVAGVSNKELYEFCTKLPNSGCGYYPNSHFVHMDARDESAVWTDFSGVGQKAQYKKIESSF